MIIDWIMTRTRKDKPRGMRWKPNTVLEDIDFGEDSALISSRLTDLQENKHKLAFKSSRVGVKIHTKMCKPFKSE